MFNLRGERKQNFGTAWTDFLEFVLHLTKKSRLVSFQLKLKLWKNYVNLPLYVSNYSPCTSKHHHNWLRFKSPMSDGTLKAFFSSSLLNGLQASSTLETASYHVLGVITMCITRHRHAVKSCVYTKDSPRRFLRSSAGHSFFFARPMDERERRVNGKNRIRHKKVEDLKSRNCKRQWKDLRIEHKEAKILSMLDPSSLHSRCKNRILCFPISQEVETQIEKERREFSQKTDLLNKNTRAVPKTFLSRFSILFREINLKRIS